MARTYTELWEEVKRNGCIDVHCPLDLRSRIRKALFKERARDTAWRDRNPTAILTCNRTDYGLRVALHTAVPTKAL